MKCAGHIHVCARAAFGPPARGSGPCRARPPARDVAPCRAMTAAGFGLANLPYGIFRRSGSGEPPRAGVRFEDGVLDLAVLASDGLIDDPRGVFDQPSLNAFLAPAPGVAAPGRRLRGWSRLPTWSRSPTCCCLPVEVADYVDFYASLDHASNVGRIFRPDGDALTPNWRHLPIGYHGRAGTVVVSGTPVTRPSGQEGAGRDGPDVRPEPAARHRGGAGLRGRRAERAGLAGAVRRAGRPRLRGHLPERLVGPRHPGVGVLSRSGPFLGKSFATSISPWVTPLAALDAARVATARRRTRCRCRYLGAGATGRSTSPSRSSSTARSCAGRQPRHLYWSPAQQLAHLTVNGASLRTGDLFASGTIAGRSAGSAEPARAVVGREEPFAPPTARATRSSRTATRSCSAASRARATRRWRSPRSAAGSWRRRPALPKAIRRLTPDRVRDDPRLRALAVGTGVIPPRTMHSAGEAALLADLARGRRRVVEIGVFEGSSAIVLCDVLDPGAELHLIDPFGHQPSALREGTAATEWATRRVVERAAKRATAPSCSGTSTSAPASPSTGRCRSTSCSSTATTARSESRRTGTCGTSSSSRAAACCSTTRAPRSPAARGCPGPTAVVDRLFRGPRALPDWEIADEVDRAVAVRCAPRAA